MADGTNNIWVDSTFIEEDSTTEDINAEFYRASSTENIGNYSVPVIYRAIAADNDTTSDYEVEYFQVNSTASGTVNLNANYYTPVEYLDTVVSLVEFSQSLSTISGSKDVINVYSTGQYEIIEAKNYIVDYKVPTDVIEYPGVDFFLYYTNSTGYTNASGIYIPYLDYDVDTTVRYNAGTGYSTVGIDEYVDVFFAAYILFYNFIDVFSAEQGTLFDINWDVTTISGAVLYNITDIYSSEESTYYVDLESYCALTAVSGIDYEVQNIDGGLYYIDYNVYNCELENTAIYFNVDLNPIRIFNFSLDVGEYTTSSGYISVDIVDDECNITTSGTYWLVDGIQVPTTLQSIPGGYRAVYDPSDDFASIEGPTTFTIHAEDDCDYYVERDFYLTFGYIVEFNNSKDVPTGVDFGFGNKVAVRVTAEDFASCPTLSSLAWEFESKQPFNSDLSASIVGIPGGSGQHGLSAEIYPQSTAYFYGKTFRVVVNAKDYSGNQMVPLVLTYTIEDKPE